MKTITHLILRRDRLLIAAWIAVAVGVPAFNAYSLAALLPTQAARIAFIDAADANPITLALLGPVHGTSIEAVVAWRSSVQSLLIGGLAGLLFAIRHTRAEEDTGRRELVAAGAVGRYAAITAVVAVIAAVNLAVAGLQAAVLGLAFGYPADGSLLFGLVGGAGSTAFAACGLLAAQLCQSAPLARAGGVGVLVAGLVPGVILPEEAVAYLPAGWPRVARAYGDERWWVLLVPLAVALVLTLVAYVVCGRRELGAGLLPERPAPARPAPRGAAGLAWRLYGGQTASWTAALGMASVGVGWVSASFEVGTLTGETLLEIFTYVFCMVVACLAVTGALRPLGEESRGRASAVLATATGRTRWLGGHLVLGLAAPAAMLLVVGVGTGAGHALGTGLSDTVLTQVGTALVFVPAAWAVAGVAIASYGLRPRAAVPLAWAVLVGSAVCVAMWEAGTIGTTAFLLTPFGYGHPSLSPGFLAPAGYALAAAGLVTTGSAAFARRDLLA
ncbi:ABC transporter membrane-spanning protein [Nonomuraea monospora]|uniref:ABC transporter membrane-spanning protein n=1 Tax=Nonomuraea monospora TaxID=568818 RepID=A0ABN3CWP4_9ACTN